jgi:prepilin-type N-terminal cleavage/methylation domain-containing protein
MLKGQKGFTLIELAIVITIMSILIGLSLSSFLAFVTQQKYTQNQSLLNQNYDDLVGYIMVNGKLPLASSNTNGTSQSGNIGYLPYITIRGLQNDAYGNTFYYAVNNRSLPVSIYNSAGINVDNATMNLTTTTNMTNFCATLYALSYYYTNQNPTLNSSDISTINNSGQTTSTPTAFVLISSGANGKLDSPNTITNSNGIFASEQYPISNTYDDMVKSMSIASAISQFCRNQFTGIKYQNNYYILTTVQ